MILFIIMILQPVHDDIEVSVPAYRCVKVQYTYTNSKGNVRSNKVNYILRFMDSNSTTEIMY